VHCNSRLASICPAFQQGFIYYLKFEVFGFWFVVRDGFEYFGSLCHSVSRSVTVVQRKFDVFGLRFEVRCVERLCSFEISVLHCAVVSLWFKG
jgi:hypothetical protein